jgi:hypothetical protein
MPVAGSRKAPGRSSVLDAVQPFDAPRDGGLFYKFSLRAACEIHNRDQLVAAILRPCDKEENCDAP